MLLFMNALKMIRQREFTNKRASIFDVYFLDFTTCKCGSVSTHQISWDCHPTQHWKVQMKQWQFELLSCVLDLARESPTDSCDWHRQMTKFGSNGIRKQCLVRKPFKYWCMHATIKFLPDTFSVFLLLFVRRVHHLSHYHLSKSFVYNQSNVAHILCAKWQINWLIESRMQEYFCNSHLTESMCFPVVVHSIKYLVEE